ACFDRRFHNSKNGAVVLDAGVVFGYRSSRRSLFGFIVSREIAADLLPALSFIGRFEKHIRRGVKGIRVMRRKDDWEIPLETVFQIPQPTTQWGCQARISLGPPGGWGDPGVLSPRRRNRRIQSANLSDLAQSIRSRRRRRRTSRCDRCCPQ